MLDSRFTYNIHHRRVVNVMLYQLIKCHADGTTSQLGKSMTNLSRLAVRLGKLKKGWIQRVLPDTTKQVVKARGFSKDAMAAIKACGVELC